MSVLKVSRAWLKDAGERVGFTFLQAFLGAYSLQGLFALSSGHLDLTLARTAGTAGLAAVFALVKAFIASKVAGTVSPASFAPTDDTGGGLP